MKAWHEVLDASTVQRIRTYSAFNDATSKNLMVQIAMEEGYRLAESAYQKHLINFVEYVSERKLEEDFCKYKEMKGEESIKDNDLITVRKQDLNLDWYRKTKQKIQEERI